MIDILKNFYDAISIIDLIYLIITLSSLISCYKKGFVLSSVDNNEGSEGIPFSLNFITSLYLESIFWLNGSASFANSRLDRVYS